MIISFFLDVIRDFLTVVFSIMPVAGISDIPYIGQFTYDLLVSMVGIWNAFLITFPYAEIVWTVFVFIILPFEFLMLFAKVILGSRVPAHTN